MSDTFPQHGRLAGIDYGTVRVGIAVCDPARTLASPLRNYTRGDLQADQRYFQQLADSEAIVAFVIGLPVHVSGDESQKSLEARQFGEWLGELTRLPVRFYDERYSTVQAEAALDEAGLTRKQRKQRRDMLAAQIILSAFL